MVSAVKLCLATAIWPSGKPRLNRFIWLGLFFSLSLVRAGAQAIDWPTLGFTQIVTNSFNHPVGITHAGDGSQRMFVVEQPGNIWIVQNNNVLPQPFLSITNIVTSAGAEQGLLGLAFPPGFSTNHHFYVDYTRQPDGAIVVARFFLTATNSNVADTNSGQTVMVIPKPSPVTTYNNHNAGQLAFGPDGNLYIGVGDGGSEGDPLTNGQNTANFFGKILRIDVESGVSPYAIPADNPYASSNGYAHEIWAYGLRNPWRFSFDDQTGGLYIGDVGQNSYEEIDFQPAGSAGGRNYGWRIMEGYSNYDIPPGFTNFSALTLPVAVYPHTLVPTDLSAAVIGGYVYRGPSQPRMDGMYFFGDFEAGWIWGLKQVGTNWQNEVLVSPPQGSNHFLISTFGEDDQHNLYLADYATGLIYQIQDSLAAWTPTFSPTGGVINSNTVIVSCLTTNAQIHYTTNGVNPTLSDPIIPSGGLLTVATGITNKIWAYRPDLAPSGVATATYTLQVAVPVFFPPGPIANGATISISCATPGAEFYYTTNGTTPATNSTLYSGPIIFQTNFVLKALGAENGYNNSTVATSSYSLAQVATPVFNPSVGPITNGTFVSLSCSTPGSTIYYTLDGSAPTINSLVYLNPFSINSGSTVTAFATANFYANSGVSSVTYLFKSMENTVVTTVARGLSLPYGVCVDQNGNLYVANYGSGAISKILPSGQSTNIAAFDRPSGIRVDSAGNLYLADFYNQVWKLPSHGAGVVLAQLTGNQNTTGGLALDPGYNIYVGFSGSVQEVTSAGTVNWFAGPKCINCTGTGWSTFVGVGMDAATNIYAATGNAVWQIAQNGTTVLYAGGNPGYADGPALSALFQGPHGAVVDASSNVFVTDISAVRKISPAGYVSTMAGSGITGDQDGPGSIARFDFPVGICLDTNGNLFVADAVNGCIREISPDTFGIGIADWWQLKYFGHIGIDPNSDPNNNGMTAYEDFWAGLNPTNPASVFKVESANVSASGTKISWDTVLGKNYAVQRSSDLIAWTTIASSIAGTGSITSYTDPILIATPQFYRIVVSY